ncbi:Uncharacterised protein [Streptococcus pasteurianus]|nr:Uncharacterised protein [Streptococcus pasteurianus]
MRVGRERLKKILAIIGEMYRRHVVNWSGRHHFNC